MAEELTDAEVFGKPELTDEEVFANLAPPAQTKQEKSMQAMRSGEPPANIMRVVRNPVVRATAASIIAPEALVGMVPELAPAAAAGTMGYLARLGLSGAASGGAYEAVLKAHDLEGVERDPAQATRDVVGSMALGSALNLVGGAVGQKIFQTAAGALGRAVARKPKSVAELGGAIKSGAAEGFVRPLFESTTAAETRAASEMIENATGIKPAQSLGEALGKKMFGGTYADLERELGTEAAGAMSPEARNKVSQAVLYTASNLIGSGARPGQVAEQTITALQKEIGKEISGPARAAAKQFADELDTALKSATAKTVAEAATLATPSGAASPYTAGNVGKEAERQAVEAFDAQETALYDQYRTLLGNTPPQAGLKNSSKTAEQILNGALKTTDASGTQVPIGSVVQDADTRKYLSQIQQASGTPQDIEALRMFRSQVGESLGQPGVLSGMPEAAKKRLYGALSQDIDEALNLIPDPSVKAALKTANKFRTDNIDKFKLASMDKAGTAVEEGGTTGQSLFRSVLGDTDRYKLFQNVLGPRFAAFKESARDAILSEAQQGGFSIGTTLKAIEKLPSEVQKDMFPQAARLRQLAEKEVKIANLNGTTPKDPEKVLDWMKANEAEVKGFLSPGGEQKFLDALHVRATEQRRFNNTILADVAQGKSDAIARDPVGFVDSILTGAYSKPGAVREALDVVAKHSPKTRADLQVAYLEKLLKSSTVDGIVSGEELAKRIAIPSSGKVASSGGPELEIAEEILGRAKVDNLRGIAGALGTTQKALLGKQIQARGNVMELLTTGSTPTDLVMALAIKAGSPTRNMRFLSDLINKPAQLKYQIAASLMNDPAMLPILAKPISTLKGNEAGSLINAFSRYVTAREPLKEVDQEPVEQPTQ